MKSIFKLFIFIIILFSKQSNVFMLCYKCGADGSDITSSSDGGSSSGDDFDNSSVGGKY